jgi:hypothetical protein
VRFVICWTPNGSTNGLQRDTGGTGQALRIAAAHGVEIFNLARPDHERRVRSLLNRACAPQTTDENTLTKPSSCKQSSALARVRRLRPVRPGVSVHVPWVLALIAIICVTIPSGS